MKQMLLTFALISLSSGAIIGEFAPTAVGSEWKYSYFHSEGDVGRVYTTDSFTIQIELVAKDLQGSDTLVVLRVKQEGRSMNRGRSGPLLYDTVGSASFFDTAIISGFSISRSGGYQCRIFPFWETLNIDETPPGRATVTDDTLHASTPSLYGSYYVRNIGLYYYSIFEGAIRHTTTLVNIISFNGKLFPVGVTYAGKSFPRSETFHPGKIKALSFTHTKAPCPVFSLTGKKMAAGENLPNGIVITDGTEPITR